MIEQLHRERFMIPASMFSINTYDKQSLQNAKDFGFGLEVEEYLWLYNKDEILKKREYITELVGGFAKLSFHGTAVNRDVTEINKLSDDDLLAIYNESYSHSCFHGIKKIVFHSNYLVDFQPQNVWLNEKAAFWRRFLVDKPSDFYVYIENFVDDTPDLLAELHDRVDDSRFKICLDTGHACCNSSINLNEWIKKLGKRVEHVHLHNNDKTSDKHWSLSKGVLDMAEIIRYLLMYADVQVFVLECDFEDSFQWLQKNSFLSI